MWIKQRIYEKWLDTFQTIIENDQCSEFIIKQNLWKICAFTMNWFKLFAKRVSNQIKSKPLPMNSVAFYFKVLNNEFYNKRNKKLTWNRRIKIKRFFSVVLNNFNDNLTINFGDLIANGLVWHGSFKWIVNDRSNATSDRYIANHSTKSKLKTLAQTTHVEFR